MTYLSSTQVDAEPFNASITVFIALKVTKNRDPQAFLSACGSRLRLYSGWSGVCTQFHQEC